MSADKRAIIVHDLGFWMTLHEFWKNRNEGTGMIPVHCFVWARLPPISNYWYWLQTIICRLLFVPFAPGTHRSAPHKSTNGRACRVKRQRAIWYIYPTRFRIATSRWNFWDGVSSLERFEYMSEFVRICIEIHHRSYWLTDTPLIVTPAAIINAFSNHTADNKEDFVRYIKGEWPELWEPVPNFKVFQFETQIESRTWLILCSFRPHTCAYLDTLHWK